MSSEEIEAMIQRLMLELENPDITQRELDLLKQRLEIAKSMRG